MQVDLIYSQLIRTSMPELHVHLGQGLVLSAEQKPTFIINDLVGYFDGFSGGYGMLLIEFDLMGQLYGIVNPFLQQEVQMNLKCPENIVFLFIIRVTSQNQAELFVIVLISRIFIKKNDRLISLPMKQGSFLDKIQLLLANLINQTFKETINFLLFIAKDQQIISLLIFKMTDVRHNQSIAYTDRVIVFQRQLFVSDLIQSYAFLLDSYEDVCFNYQDFVRLIEQEGCFYSGFGLGVIGVQRKSFYVDYLIFLRDAEQQFIFFLSFLFFLLNFLCPQQPQSLFKILSSLEQVHKIYISV